MNQPEDVVTGKVLDADEVAQRLTRSMLRTLRALMSVRQVDPDFFYAVRVSRHYSSGLDTELQAELARWLDYARPTPVGTDLNLKSAP